MKNLYLFLIFTILFSCEYETTRPDCIILNQGTVHIENRTGYTIWVDVTWDDMIENDVADLKKDLHVKYLSIPAGEVKVWASFDQENWIVVHSEVITCEEISIFLVLV